MALDDVIAGAVAEARESGVVGETDGEDQAVETEVADDDTTEETDTDDSASGDEGDDDAGEESEDSEQGDESGEDESEDESGDEEESEEESEEEETEEEPEPETDDDKLAKALGVDAKLKGKDRWKAKVPFSKVKAYVKENGAAPVLATVAKVFGVDASRVTTASLERGLTKVFTDLTELKGRAENFDKLEPLMMSEKDEDNDRFMAAIAAVNPRFKRYIDGTGSKKAALPAAEDDPEPEGDVEIDLGNGQKGKTFSKEGYKKYIAWLRRDITREVKAEQDARFKPFEDATAAVTRREEDAAAQATRVQNLLADASEWDGFKENEDAIQEAYVELKKANPSWEMEKVMQRAYQKVVIGSLKKSKQKVRDEVLDEGKKRVKASSAPTGGAKKKAPVKTETPQGEGGDRLTNVIRGAVAKAKAGGIK